MASKRDKKTGYIYRICQAVEKRFDKQFEAEQKLLKMERELRIKSQPLHDLKCEVDPFIDPDEATIADVVKMLNLLSGQIDQLNRRMDYVQKEVNDVKKRVVRIERTMDNTLSTVEKVKDMVLTSETREEVIPLVEGFEFEAITQRRQLYELENRLATDTEYVTNITNWLKREIKSEIPYHRMYEAMDIVFDRKFMPQCSWAGGGQLGPRIPLREQTNILELFRMVGGNRFTTVTDTHVADFFRKNLPYAKSRAHTKRGRPTYKMKI